jgi:hypothetical protein
LPLVDGNRVWLNDTYQPGSIYVLNSAGSYVLDCQSAVNAYSFKWGGAPPSVKNPYPATVAFTLHAECNQGAVVLDEMGYGYWANSRCSGIRYEVTNGTVSY